MLESNVDLWNLARGVLHAYPPLAPEEQRLVRVGQRALVDGMPVSIERLGRLADLPIDVVAGVFERLPGVARFDREQRVVGLLGLSAEPTPHRFDAVGRIVYTWCAWDALFIPRVIGMRARVASHCPVTSALIRLIVAPEGIVEVSPTDVTMSFLAASAPEGLQGVAGACCPHIHFLSSPAAADRWLSSQPGGLVLTLDEAWQLGRRFVDDVLFVASTEATSR